ncbi:MAG: transposase [Candidatus Parcubacteria bacterium]|nr:transposase [Candidatus Parcubacteria bacterium]
MKFYLDYNYYFLTSRTIDGLNCFENEDNRKLLLGKILSMQSIYDFSYDSYCILRNHYHILFYLKTGKDVPKIIQKINGGVSFLLENISKPIWDSYYISNVFNQEAYYKVMGYILGNPWKHGLVEDIYDLNKYEYSNYNNLLTKYEKKSILEIIGNVKNLNWELNLPVEKYKY